ncbi:MAG: head-tail adaptor protein [Anaerolineae bacterium]|nr:head-tail adaptor protein [Anaerolineae bacterium]
MNNIRFAQRFLLTGECTVWRNMPTFDAAGGQIDQWNSVGTYPCRLMPERDRRLQQIIGEKNVLEVYYRLTLPYNADLRAGDRVVCDGQTYEVVALWDSYTFKTALRVVVSQMS